MVSINSIEDELSDEWLDAPFREGLIHQAVETFEANQRVDLATTKDRGKVAGPNKKPWRQKGTGRARHGSRKDPLWVGGGRAHGPDGEQDHSKKLTTSMKREALRSALSERHRNNQLHIVELPELDEPSTSTMHEELFGEFEEGNEIALVHGRDEKTIRLSTRNLDYCEPIEAGSLTTHHVVAHSTVLFTEDGLEQFKERASNGS
ncbi:MAG: 50S ribosomal protein L4 [bacterium]